MVALLDIIVWVCHSVRLVLCEPNSFSFQSAMMEFMVPCHELALPWVC